MPVNRLAIKIKIAENKHEENAGFFSGQTPVITGSKKNKSFYGISQDEDRQ